MKELTKLDNYEYMVLPGVILIEMDSSVDPSMVDILSEIDHSKGMIYLDGHYYEHISDEKGGYEIIKNTNKIWLELRVVEIDYNLMIGGE